MPDSMLLPLDGLTSLPGLASNPFTLTPDERYNPQDRNGYPLRMYDDSEDEDEDDDLFDDDDDDFMDDEDDDYYDDEDDDFFGDDDEEEEMDDLDD